MIDMVLDIISLLLLVLLLVSVNLTRRRLMADLSKLTAVTAGIKQALANLSTDLARALNDFKAGQANNDQPAIDAATADLQTVLDGLNTLQGNVDAADPPPPPASTSGTGG